LIPDGWKCMTPSRCAGAGLLAANYVGAVTAALRMPGAFNARLMVPAHLLLAAVLAAETTRLDRARHTPQAVAAFYRGVWNLFYAGAPLPSRAVRRACSGESAESVRSTPSAAGASSAGGAGTGCKHSWLQAGFQPMAGCLLYSN